MIEPIVMPKWGLAMQEGMVAEWHIAPGAEITAGQEIMDIETSKIANVYESPVGGTFRKIVVENGATVPVGALLGVVAPADVDDAAARRDWGFAPRHGLEQALREYLVPALRARYGPAPV